jgi:hypothetical protein
MEAIAPVAVGDAGEDFFFLVDTDEHGSFQEAQGYKCWQKAMLDEITAIEMN